MEGKHPSGIKVFGSAVIRVEPDSASLQFAVSRQAKQPKDAFQLTHKTVKAVSAYLSQMGMNGNVATSRILLQRTFEYTAGRQLPTGYSAKVTFNVLLSDLDKMEELLVGVVDSGANEIENVEFRTTRLKELRAEARRRAVAAGREKAENYCRAAGVTLGIVNAMEDLNPAGLRGTGEGYTTTESSSDDDPVSENAFTPGCITVGAAVSLVFEILPAIM